MPKMIMTTMIKVIIGDKPIFGGFAAVDDGAMDGNDEDDDDDDDGCVSTDRVGCVTAAEIEGGGEVEFARYGGRSCSNAFARSA